MSEALMVLPVSTSEDLSTLARISEPRILCPADAGRAADAITLAVSVKKALMAFSKEAKAPYKRQIDRIDASINPHLDRAKAVEAAYKEALVAYRQQEQARLLEAAEKESDRRLAEEAEIASELQTEGVDRDTATRMAVMETSETSVPMPLHAPTVAVGEIGMVRVVKRPWTYEVTDEMAVPRGFMEPSHARIMVAIREGNHVIAGLRIYQPETVRA